MRVSALLSFINETYNVLLVGKFFIGGILMNYKMVLVSIIAVFSVGCSALGIGTGKQQDAIVKFINDDVEEASQHQENSALLFNEMLMDPEIEEDVMVDRIKNEVIPEAEKAVDIVENIDVPIEELEEPYALLKDGLDSYTNVLNIFLKLIETNDLTIEAELDEAFSEYDTALEKYHNSIEELADEFDIEYERYEMDVE